MLRQNPTHFPSYLVKRVSCFMLKHLMTSISEKLKFQENSKSQEQKDLSNRNKNHFSLLRRCFFLESQNKLAKMSRTKPLSYHHKVNHCNV